MTDKEVCRYIDLADRRAFIVMNSGVGWRPEYAAELEAIDKELAELRRLVDQEHGRREAQAGGGGTGRAGAACMHERRQAALEGIVEAVKAGMGEGYEAGHREAVKNNGVILQGVWARRHGSACCPQVYVDGLLDKITGGEASVEEAAREVIGVFRRGLNEGERYVGILAGLSREDVLGRVVYKLVRTEGNGERLERLFHKELMDMSAVYLIALDEGRSGMVSVAASDAVCRRYGIGLEELDVAARENTWRAGFCIRRVVDILAEAVYSGPGDPGVEGPEMYVVTSKSCLNGAAAMLYPELFGELAQMLGADLYVLPSSIHEVIVVPACGNPDDLRKVVAEVNRSGVAGDEVLSGNVYRYSRQTGGFSVA